MSQYTLIVATLREFELITEAQMEKAIDEWQAYTELYEIQKNAFREEWVEAWHKRSWWRRLGGFQEYEWLLEWLKLDQDQRWTG